MYVCMHVCACTCVFMYLIPICVLSVLASAADEKFPVHVADFESHVERMHKNQNHGFSVEYTVISIWQPM